MIVVAIGANLPRVPGESARDACLWAVDRLRALPGPRLVAVSRWYRTAPVPASDQPDYCNGVALLDGDPGPAELLASLHAIEAEAGRARRAANEARPLDLDLIDYHRLQNDAPALVLPHPRAHLRRFVLLPLRDAMPDWRHPISDLPLDALIAAAPDDPVALWDGA